MTTCQEPQPIRDRESTLNLAVQRRQKGISLEQIAEETKIGLHFLRAIEADDFKALPGGLYDLSYIRQYARAASLDAKLLVDHYLLVTSPAPEVGSSPVSPREHAVRNFLKLLGRTRRAPHPA